MFFQNPNVGRFLPLARQARHWKAVTKKMRWSIPGEEFQAMGAWVQSMPSQHYPGFSGVVLCYGFGDDGGGGSDAVLSSERAWQYARRLRRIKTWQCQNIHLHRPDH